jgi:hypothetical protein
MVGDVRILFLEVDTERAWAVASVGPAFIGAYLRAHGHEVELLRADVDMDEAEIVARVRAADPDLLGVSLTTRQWLRGRAAVGAIRAAQYVHGNGQPRWVAMCTVPSGSSSRSRAANGSASIGSNGGRSAGRVPPRRQTLPIAPVSQPEASASTSSSIASSPSPRHT